MARVGYRRVSSLGQNLGRQLEGLELDEVFEDVASGKDVARPQWAAAERYLRRGDTLVVHSMDRLARSLRDLLGLVESLVGRGVEVQFVSENLVFSPASKARPMDTLMMSMLGAFAEFERSLILERQREGIALAKARGAYKGRKRVLNPQLVEVIRKRLESGEKVTDVAWDLGVSRQTVYSYLRA